MCHILPLTKCKIQFEMEQEECAVYCTCTVKVDGKTGVEMEALTGVSVALLTIYDMCKALDKTMEIGEIYLVRQVRREERRNLEQTERQEAIRYFIGRNVKEWERNGKRRLSR